MNGYKFKLNHHTCWILQQSVNKDVIMEGPVYDLVIADVE